jgi:hypothetical protein
MRTVWHSTNLPARWSIPLRNSLTPTADRNVFRLLTQEFRGRATGLATAFYTVNENDFEQPQRVAAIGPDFYQSCGQAAPKAEQETRKEIKSYAPTTAHTLGQYLT